MLDAIATPFGWLMMRLYELTDNFGWAIILFAIVVALVLLPFMAKSKKSMMRMTRLQPRMMELQKKHEATRKSSTRRWHASTARTRSAPWAAACGACCRCSS